MKEQCDTTSTGQIKQLFYCRRAEWPVLEGVPLSTQCTPIWPPRLVAAGVCYAQAEGSDWAWELLPGRLQDRPRAEGLAKVRGQPLSSANQSRPSAQRPTRKTRTTQVRKLLFKFLKLIHQLKELYTFDFIFLFRSTQRTVFLEHVEVVLSISSAEKKWNTRLSSVSDVLLEPNI